MHYSYLYFESLSVIPAVHQDWSLAWFVLSLDPSEVVESGSSVLWYTVVWPRGEVILHHLSRGTTLTSMLIFVLMTQ